MVILRTINHMKDRPKDERVAFAGSIAVGVVVVLFLGWGALFITRARPTASQPAAVEASSTPAVQDQSAALFDQSTQDQNAQVQLDSTSTATY